MVTLFRQYLPVKSSCISRLCHMLVSHYAPQLYRQVLLWRVLAMGILSVCPSVCHDPVVYQAQVR